MKCCWLVLLFLLPGYFTLAQQAKPLPHGMVFGAKPDTSNALEVSKLRSFMGKKIRISTVLKGKIKKVTKEKGGWFELDAGNDHSIPAHFKNYKVNLPADIKGRVVIVDCVAKKNIRADDHQRFAGDTVTYKLNETLARKISLEVNGLMIYK